MRIAAHRSLAYTDFLTYSRLPLQEAPTYIADLIPKALGLVAHYLPQLKYLLIAQNQYTDETLTAMHNLVAAIIRVEHPASRQTL